MSAIPLEPAPPGASFVLCRGSVNATPATFVVDTGAVAPFTVLLTPAFADRAAAVPHASAAVSSIGAIGPEQVMLQPAAITELTLGSLRVSDPTACISSAIEVATRPLGIQIDGVIGHSFLAQRTLSIDFTKREIDFEAACGPDAEAIPFRLAPKRAITIVDVMVNSQGPFTFALDTGATATVLSPATAQATGVATTTDLALRGAGGNVAGGARLGGADIAVGGMRREQQIVAVADILAPIEVAIGAKLDGVIGPTFFIPGKLTIDYRTNRLWIQGDAP